MSLDKKRELRARWFEENMPPEQWEPPFPYIAEFGTPIGIAKSPMGFDPIYYGAHISLTPLPEDLRVDPE